MQPARQEGGDGRGRNLELSRETLVVTMVSAGWTGCASQSDHGTIALDPRRPPIGVRVVGGQGREERFPRPPLGGAWRPAEPECLGRGQRRKDSSDSVLGGPTAESRKMGQVENGSVRGKKTAQLSVLIQLSSIPIHIPD